MATDYMPPLSNLVQLGALDELGQSGIYFLVQGGEVVYVGQAKNMRRRIGTHLYENIKKFDAISYVPCAIENLDWLEREYIERLTPRHNCTFINTLEHKVRAKAREMGVVVLPLAGYVTAGTAAEFLGVPVDVVQGWVSEGIAPQLFVERHGRGRTRRPRGYSAPDLRKFADNHASLIAEAKKQAA